MLALFPHVSFPLQFYSAPLSGAICWIIRSPWQGSPTTVFCENVCSKRQKLPGIVLSLGKAKDSQITVPFMYSYQNLYPDKKCLKGVELCDPFIDW